MSSASQLAMREALEAFSQGDIGRADTILESATREGKARAEVNDALSLCCMRASIAAMEGAANVPELMRPVGNTRQGAAATCYLEGIAALAKNSQQTARVKFEEALRKDPHFKLANLGLAAVYFQMENYKTSFAQYREVLTKLGSVVCPPVVRVGMGLCAYYMDSLGEAERFLERALAVNADDELALFGLLVVYLDRRNMRKVTEVVSRLRGRMPHNSLVLLKVGDLLYFKALGTQRVKAAQQQIQQVLTEVRRHGTPEECAMADFQEGRLLLIIGDLDTAQLLLEAALRTFPGLLAGRVHYARLLHHAGRERDALQLLRAIDAEHPNQREVLQLLALYASRSGQNEAALKYCRLLTQTVAQGDLGSWSLAAWCNRLHAKEHKQLLTQVVNIHRELGMTPPWQLLANVAVVHKDTDALQAIVDHELGGDFLTSTARGPLATEHVPLVFNLALLLEPSAPARARQLYAHLVKQHATFAAPFLRLHTMAKHEGKAQQAVAWLTLLARVVPDEPNAPTGIAQAFFDAEHHGVAVKVLKSAASRAVPVALAQGTTYLWCCQNSRTSAPQYLRRAKDRFIYVLNEDHDNILAAHGLACCLGLERHGDRSQALLNGVNEVAPNCPYVRDNLSLHMANVNTLSERYKQAADHLLRLPQRTPQQSSLLAFCFACDGRHDEAIDTLTAALGDDGAAANPLGAGGVAVGMAAAASSSKRRMLRYNLAVVCCSAFLRTVAACRSISVEEGSRLNRLLEKGITVAFEFTQHQPSSSMQMEARRCLKSLCVYTMHVHDTIFKQLVAVGAESKVEQEREAVRWRATFAAFRAELERQKRQQLEEDRRAEEERKEEAHRLYDAFLARRQSDPIDFANEDILRARETEALADNADLMQDPEDGAEGLTGLEANAALAAMDFSEQAFEDPNEYAG